MSTAPRLGEPFTRRSGPRRAMVSGQKFVGVCVECDFKTELLVSATHAGVRLRDHQRVTRHISWVIERHRPGSALSALASTPTERLPGVETWDRASPRQMEPSAVSTDNGARAIAPLLIGFTVGFLAALVASSWTYALVVR